jgi:hypothetical protein
MAARARKIFDAWIMYGQSRISHWAPKPVRVLEIVHG